MKATSASVVVILSAGGMLLVLTLLILKLMLPASDREPIRTTELIDAARRCDGQIEIYTDARNRPLMVTCLVGANQRPKDAGARGFAND